MASDDRAINTSVTIASPLRTQEEARQRLCETLDDVLLSLRQRSDDQRNDSFSSLVNSLILSTYGVSSSTFDRGVVFGLDFCPLQSIASYLSDDEVGIGWFDSDISADSWVVTRGALYDGTSLINLEPDEVYDPHVYQMLPPSSLVGANCYAIGAVLYLTSSGTFTTRMLGQSSSSEPPVMIEKTNVSLSEVKRAAFGENPQDVDFKVSVDSDEILIGRFLLDVEKYSTTTQDYSIHGRNVKDRYPLASGLPYMGLLELAAALSDDLSFVLDPTFDSTIAYDLMSAVVNAATWGDFHDYWSDSSRSVPENVKYYYNLIWDPDIS